ELNVESELGPRYLATSGISAFKNAPHPNATKVFVNWFLSREGQFAWTEAWDDRHVSRRLDVPSKNLHGTPDWSRLDSYASPNTERGKDLPRTIIEIYRQLAR